jgi:ADP-heptose:LPS heptosyltransferase
MERILVIKLSALGDFILALGSMAAIRKQHPDAHITLLTTRPFIDMAQRSGYFNAVHEDTRPGYLDFLEWKKLYNFFNAGDFTRVYDLQLNDRTGFYYKLFHKKPEWSGVVRGAKLFYANPEWRQMHAFMRHRKMMEEVGIDMRVPDLSWMASDISLLGLKKPYVLLIPGSAPQHPEKRWPAMKFAALGLKLMRDGFEIAVLGTSADADAVEKVIKACPGAKDLSGRTSLYDIATLARGASAAISNDTGPAHLIALTGCPVAVLFSGTTNPDLSAPVGAAVTIIQSQQIDGISVDDVMKNLHPRKVTEAA